MEDGEAKVSEREKDIDTSIVWARIFMTLSFLDGKGTEEAVCVGLEEGTGGGKTTVRGEDSRAFEGSARGDRDLGKDLADSAAEEGVFLARFHREEYQRRCPRPSKDLEYAVAEETVPWYAPSSSAT